MKHGYGKTYGITLMPLQPLSLNHFWLSGFTDADGCFNIYVRNSKSAQWGKRTEIRLIWSQKNVILRKAIQGALGLPGLYHYDRPQK
jgi:LAGLIDADG endonuclease